jgi:competence protein ComEC
MPEEIQKRPFARPLFWWITGIVLQVCFPLQQVSWLLLFLVVGMVVVSFFFVNQTSNVSYQNRWVWGALISCLFLFLSIQSTDLAEKRLAMPAKSSWVKEKAKNTQAAMVAKLDGLRVSDDEKAILATLTVNYRIALSRETRSRFTAAGVAHILSVSGFHVGIVCAFFGLLFAAFPKFPLFHWLKYILTILLVWAYAFIAGLSNPAVRAAIMLSIYLVGQMLNRRPERYNSLAAAAFCMLAYNPFALFDIGFQLSFTAVFFILYLQPKFYRLIELRNPIFKTLWGILTVTTAAQIGTVFLACFYFGQSSTVFLFTNLLLSLVATIIIPLTLLWMILPAAIPGLGILQWVIEVLSKSMMEVVNRFSQIPGAAFSIRFDLITLLCAYGILGLFLCYLNSKQIRLLFSALILILFLLCRELFLAM